MWGLGKRLTSEMHKKDRFSPSFDQKPSRVQEIQYFTRIRVFIVVKAN